MGQSGKVPAGLGLAILLLVTCVVYFSGLDSRFILDDIYNLHGLADIEEHGFLNYIFGSGFAGPGGRPVSLLSFALQYQDWPRNPFAFKLANLVLHLINGTLLYLFSIRLSKGVLPDRKQSKLFALLVTGLWLLHPVQVNTVLYTVQRMTEISALFCLLGMTGYLYGRPLIETGKVGKGLIWITLSVLGCTGLAVLSKENGVLLPLYILVIEITLFTGQYRSPSLRYCLWIVLLLPVVSFLIYIILNLHSIQSAFAIRGFTPLERVLTELTVLMDYLKIIVFPHPSAFTLFHDNYPVSRGLLTPVFTLVAFLIIVALLLLSWLFRKKYPVPAFGVLLFFTGHLLEAGPLSLELYFEHRNYLPSAGIMIVIAWFVVSAMTMENIKKSAAVFLGIYSVSLAAITADQVYLWTDPVKQVTGWSASRPGSDRAKYELATIYMDMGEYEQAEQIFRNQVEKYENDLYPLLRWIHIRTCKRQRDLPTGQREETLERARTPLRFSLATIAALDYMVLDVVRNQCTATTADFIENLLLTLTTNPDSSLDNAFLYEFLSSLAAFNGDLDKAVGYIRASLSLKQDVDRKLREINLLGILGRMGEQRESIQELERFINANPKEYLAHHKKLGKLDTGSY